MMLRSLRMLVLLPAVALLASCTVSIISNGDGGKAADAASLAAAPNASEQALMDEDLLAFCGLEAKGSMDLITVLGNEDGAGIVTDGIAQSIAQQGMTGATAEGCTRAWITVLAANGLIYDPVQKTLTGDYVPAP